LGRKKNSQTNKSKTVRQLTTWVASQGTQAKVRKRSRRAINDVNKTKGKIKNHYKSERKKRTSGPKPNQEKRKTRITGSHG